MDFGDEVGTGDVDESAGGDGNYKRRESVYFAAKGQRNDGA